MNTEKDNQILNSEDAKRPTDAEVEQAIQCLNSEGTKPSAYGAAVAILYAQYGSYQAIAKVSKVKRSANYFIKRHHAIYQLPKGIQWQCDQKKITPAQAWQLCQLKREDDRWQLALAIVEAKPKLSTKEVESVIKQIKAGKSLADALRQVAGVSKDVFTKGVMMTVPLDQGLLLNLTRRAWEQQEQRADIAYSLIIKGLANNLEQIGEQLIAIGKQLTQN